MAPCQHEFLKKLGGRNHASGRDYRCTSCGEQFKAEWIAITVRLGTHQERTDERERDPHGQPVQK